MVQRVVSWGRAIGRLLVGEINPSSRWGRMSKVLGVGVWGAFVFALLCWIFLRAGGDRWWVGTLFLYGPRWITLLPVILLLPAGLLRPRFILPLFLSLCVLAGPVLGLCLPDLSLGRERVEGAPLRLVTCNTDGTHLDPRALGEYLAVTMPDVVALQEWAPEHEKGVFWQRSWNIQTAQGMCVASRYPIQNVRFLGPAELGASGGVLCCELETPQGRIRLVNLHLPTPREGIEAMIPPSWEGVRELRTNIMVRECASAMARQWLANPPGRILLAGDLNLPSESVIYQKYWGDYRDAYASAELGWGYTKYTRWFGVRIDHLLAGPGWRCRRCWVGPDVKSDHRPVLADWDWVTAEEAKAE